MRLELTRFPDSQIGYSLLVIGRLVHTRLLVILDGIEPQGIISGRSVKNRAGTLVYGSFPGRLDQIRLFEPS